MKITLRLLASSLLILLLFTTDRLIAQTNDQRVSMVKNMIQQFKEFKAEDCNTDEVINDGASFDSKALFKDGAFYAGLLKEPGDMFSLIGYQNGYTILAGKEVPTNSIDLVFSYITLPGFTALNAWYDLSSMEDAAGKNLLLSASEIEKYIDYGIIGDEFNYPVPGEFSLRQWLNRELENGESLSVKGTIYLEYPSEYQSVDFGIENSGISKSIGNISIRLVEMDRNLVTLIMKGNRRDIEDLSMVILNAEGKLFSSNSSIAIDANMYDVDKKSIRDLSDEEITASVENFSLSDMEVEQVKKIKVCGNIHRIVFTKIDSLEDLDAPLDLSMPFEF
jgi:hypothetical protein